MTFNKSINMLFMCSSFLACSMSYAILPTCQPGVSNAPCVYPASEDNNPCQYQSAVKILKTTETYHIRYTDQGGHDMPTELCCVKSPTKNSCYGATVDDHEIGTCDDSYYQGMVNSSPSIEGYCQTSDQVLTRSAP